MATGPTLRIPSHRRVAKPKTSPRQPDLGTYVGPTNNGNNACGYVAVGPGMEQAEAFATERVPCETARKVAGAAAGHTTGQRLQYRVLGFSCTGSMPGGRMLLHYRCTSGTQMISFLVA